MSNITTVILLLTLTLISLFVVSLINQQQTRKKIIHQRVNRIKRRVSELEELSANIEPLVENLRIPMIVNDEAIDLIKNMIKLSPTNPYFPINLESAEQRAEELRNTSKHDVFRLMESDAAIARSQYALTETAGIIRKRQAAGLLEVAEMESYIHDLTWSNFMIKVSSNVGQGHKAVNRGDVLKAFAFYRKALEVATEGGFKDDRQGQIISELGDILHNKRKALSPRLMPETLYNPDEKAASVNPNI